MAASQSSLVHLPNELLLNIISYLSTLELLQISLTCSHIGSLVLRILHSRLATAASLPSHALLFECSHPSIGKVQDPYLFCDYIGTPNLDDTDSANYGQHDIAGKLKGLKNCYSRYRIVRQAKSARRPARHPAGDVPGSRTFEFNTAYMQSMPPEVQPGSSSALEEELRAPASTRVHLESHELFTQLVAVANVVKTGSHGDRFRCIVKVEEGVVRVFRPWLEQIAGLNSEGTSRDAALNAAEEAIHERERIRAGKQKAAESGLSVEEEQSVLWLSYKKDVGVKCSVVECDPKELPPRSYRWRAPEEEGFATYELTYDELLVRTSHLLQSIDKSEFKTQNMTGRAVAFGYFD